MYASYIVKACNHIENEKMGACQPTHVVVFEKGIFSAVVFVPVRCLQWSGVFFDTVVTGPVSIPHHPGRGRGRARRR